MPLREWLKNELYDWTLNVLSEDSLNNRGIFDATKVHELIKKNVSGNIDASYTIFSMICIEIWFREFLDKFKLM